MARAYARAERRRREREAEAAKARAEYEAFMASQGLAVQPAPQVTAAPANLREIGAVLKQSFEGFKDAVGETFDDRRDVLDPGDAELNRPVPRSRTRRSGRRSAAAERAERDRARAPFRAPEAPPIVFTRFATTGRAQLEDVVGALQSPGWPRTPSASTASTACPTASTSPQQEAGAYLEWEIAHQPGALPPPPRRPDRRVQAVGPLGGAAAGRAVRARRGRRRRAGRPRARRPRGLLRPAPPAQRARPRLRGEHVLDAGDRGRAAVHAAAGRDRRRPAGDDGRGAARPRAAAVPRRGPRLGGRRRLGLAAPLRPAARSLAAAAPAEHLAGAARGLSAGRRRAQRGHLRRPGDAHRRALDRRPLDGELAQEPPRRAEGHARRRARRDRLSRQRRVRGGPGALARLPAPGAARPPGPPDRRAAADRGRRPPAPVVPLRGLRHVRPVQRGPTVPQIFNRNERPSLGPYCGERED